MSAIRGAAVALLLAGCSDASSAELDAGADGGVRTLRCDAPLSVALRPSPYPANAGVPIAGVAWTGDHCALEVDEMHPDLVLVVADFAGTVLGDTVVAARAGRWVIASSSAGSGPTTYVTIPRDTDVSIELERGAVRVSMTVRLAGNTLTLLSMRLS